MIPSIRKTPTASLPCTKQLHPLTRLQTLPSLAICTNAARSTSHIIEVSRQRRGDTPQPFLMVRVARPPAGYSLTGTNQISAFLSSLILLLNVWSGKRTGLPAHMNSALDEVHKCMESIHLCDQRSVSPCFQPSSSLTRL
jgi:hypothetical protein